jgi:hypothetical protein
MALQAIVYVSSATRLLEKPELDRLLQLIRERNSQEDITGFLMYCDGNFMQYIEGPAETLQHVFQKICADASHANIVEMINQPISAREFNGWSMAYAKAHIETFNELCSASWQPESGASLSQGQFLLRNFWAQCNG